MSNSAKILIVEDDNDIAELMKMQLEFQGHEVTILNTGEQAMGLVGADHGFKLYILDWMLPGVSGLEICRAIKNRDESKQIPVLMVTALTSPENIIQGLDAGADDYISKPFDNGVLQARVRALLRRGGGSDSAQSEEVEIGDLKINFSKIKVWYKSEEVLLTQSEYGILGELMKRPGMVFTRKQLYESIQGPNIYASDRTIDTHIAGLRKKIGDAGKMIETIRGVGYRFIDY